MLLSLKTNVNKCYTTWSDLRCFLVSVRFRYSEDDVVSYIVQILQGLDYLHARRILHLDIKPENIIVTHMNLVKIIDFGSAQTYNPLFLKQFSPPIGTLEYMCKSSVCVQTKYKQFTANMYILIQNEKTNALYMYNSLHKYDIIHI